MRNEKQGIFNQHIIGKIQVIGEFPADEHN